MRFQQLCLKSYNLQWIVFIWNITTLIHTGNSFDSRFSSGPLIFCSGNVMASTLLTSRPCFRIEARMCQGSRVQEWFWLRMIGKQMRDKRGITWEMKIYYGTIILWEIINITWQRQTFIICILFWWFHCCTGCCPPGWWCSCRPEGALERRRQPFLTAEALSGQDGEERTRSGLACRSLEINWKRLFLNSLIGWYGVMWYCIKCF